MDSFPSSWILTPSASESGTPKPPPSRAPHFAPGPASGSASPVPWPSPSPPLSQLPSSLPSPTFSATPSFIFEYGLAPPPRRSEHHYRCSFCGFNHDDKHPSFMGYPFSSTSGYGYDIPLPLPPRQYGPHPLRQIHTVVGVEPLVHPLTRARQLGPLPESAAPAILSPSAPAPSPPPPPPHPEPYSHYATYFPSTWILDGSHNGVGTGADGRPARPVTISQPVATVPRCTASLPIRTSMPPPAPPAWKLDAMRDMVAEPEVGREPHGKDEEIDMWVDRVSTHGSSFVSSPILPADDMKISEKHPSCFQPDFAPSDSSGLGDAPHVTLGMNETYSTYSTSSYLTAANMTGT